MITVWVLTTCIPDECAPCIPSVYSSREAADTDFDKIMRSEWIANEPLDEETGEPLPYPEDPAEAHEILSRYPEWGQYELSEHQIDIGTMMPKLNHVQSIPAYAVIIRAEWERGQTQLDAIRELARRGLWLGENQLAHAGLRKIDRYPWYEVGVS